MSLIAKLLEITLEDWIYLGFAALLVSGGFLYTMYTHSNFDAQARFVMREGLDAFDDGQAPVLTFPVEEVEELNDVGAASIGYNAADERLFCMKVEDKVVTRLRLVDEISKSEHDAVAGSCSTLFSPTEFDGFTHTQPDFSQRLSEEDRSLESDIRWTCIMYDQIVQLEGEVGGLNCWKVVQTPDGHEFEPVEVGIRKAG
ncbi:hypothetical protein [Haloplanus natans]|uniref:hypothetical protein n=1 Tax=Haloplanus natans TaxID=376171 RepID=UPI000677BEA1|nr:hypothetical protein [Haloplanus natans]